MPVSHLGITVSHVPSATSFYEAALSPLGYRYVGVRGDAVGFGITEADFFIRPQRHGLTGSPNHVAFAAANRAVVHNCYAAALNAGGRPSGAPANREDDCGCFNAAVEDLDGNTLEFIFRQSSESTQLDDPSIPLSINRAHTWQDSEDRSSRRVPQDGASQAPHMRSRAQTAIDLASETSRATKRSEPSEPGNKRSRTDPKVPKAEDSKGVVGTLIGAAAAAALLFAVNQSERDGAREEAAYAASTRPKWSSTRGDPRSHDRRTSFSTPSRNDSSRTSRQSTKRSSRDSTHPARSTRGIEGPSQHEYTTTKVRQAIGGYHKDRRPPPQRSQTYDALDYAPRSGKARSSGDRHSMKRASTLPLDYRQSDLVEAPRSTQTSRHPIRSSRAVDDLRLERQDSGVSMHSAVHKSSASKPVEYRESSYAPSAAKMPLPASRPTSYLSAAQPRIPLSRRSKAVEEIDNGLDDLATIVPDDSISRVDFSKPTRSTTKSRSSRADSDRTIRPVDPGIRSLPLRPKDDGSRGRRSTHTRA